MNYPYNINIHIAEGTPEGLKVIEKSGIWSGRGIVFSRSGYTSVKNRNEINMPGVYILLGVESEDIPLIYIGEGDPVGPRIESHHKNKDFWTWCVFFTSTSNSLNKAHIQYLESMLIKTAKEAKRVHLDNSNTPDLPNLSEMEKAVVDDFLRHMMDIFPILGISAFERPPAKERKQEMLYLEGPDAEATGYPSSKGFVVLKGSKARKNNVASMRSGMLKTISSFVESGLFEEKSDSYILTQDYIFTSPSTAAEVFLARSANGRIEWKNKQGKTLKQIQEESTV